MVMVIVCFCKGDTVQIMDRVDFQELEERMGVERSGVEFGTTNLHKHK